MLKIKTKNVTLAKIIWLINKIPFLEVMKTEYPRGTFYLGIYFKDKKEGGE